MVVIVVVEISINGGSTLASGNNSKFVFVKVPFEKSSVCV